jgi:hypothetical protein
MFFKSCLSRGDGTATRYSCNTHVTDLYDMALRCTSGGTVTDDLVAVYDSKKDAYYVTLHATAYKVETDIMAESTTAYLEAIQQGVDVPRLNKKTISVFLVQMACLKRWLRTVPAATVVLMADLNTQCEAVEWTRLKFRNQHGIGREWIMEMHRPVAVSTVHFNTYNQMRFMTPNLSHMYKNTATRGDVVIVFYPEKSQEYEKASTQMVATQITCKDRLLCARSYAHPPDNRYPSHHDAVIFGGYATFNCMSTGADLKNTYEYIPGNFMVPVEKIRRLVMHTIHDVVVGVTGVTGGSVLSHDDMFTEEADVFATPRCIVLDIHLHPQLMPTLVVDPVTHDIVIEDPDAYTTSALPSSYLARYEMWVKVFRANEKLFPVHTRQYIVPYMMAWKTIITHECAQKFFERWYVLQQSRDYSLERAEVLELLLQQGRVVGLQQLTLEDIAFITHYFPAPRWHVVFRGDDVRKTVGCLIMAL